MNERTEVTAEIERRKTESEGKMSDDRFADYRRGVETGTMKSATPNVVRDCLDEIERLQTALADDDPFICCEAFKAKQREEIERLQAEREGETELKVALIKHYADWWRNTSGTPCQISRLVLSLMSDEIKRLQSLADVKTGMSWMRACDELTAECLRHKASIEALDAEIEWLKRELAEADKTIAENFGIDAENARLRTAASKAFSAGRGSRLAEVAKQASENERLQTELTESQETALRRWTVANEQQSELERLRLERDRLELLAAEQAATIERLRGAVPVDEGGGK